jgi:hypothetical protein
MSKIAYLVELENGEDPENWVLCHQFSTIEAAVAYFKELGAGAPERGVRLTRIYTGGD